MIAVLPGGGDAGGRWRMVARTPTGADVVARVGRRPAEPAEGGSWRQSLERLRDGDGDSPVIVMDS